MRGGEPRGYHELRLRLTLLAPPSPRRIAARAAAPKHRPLETVRTGWRCWVAVRGYVCRMPRRILFVHHRSQLGGGPTSLAQLIRGLDARFEPHVFTPPGPAAELFAAAGATVHTGPVAVAAHCWDSPYEGIRWLIFVRELAVLRRHRRALKAVLRRGEFDLVHLNDSPLLPAAQLAHRYAKVVWHLRSSLAHGGSDARSRAIRRLMERWGDAAIAIDEDVAGSFRLSIPSTIVYNAAEVEQGPDPAGAKAALGLPPGRVAVGFLGFLRRQKGWPELVQAARLVVAAEPNVQFVIIGGGIRPPEYFRTIQGRIFARLGLLSDDETAMRDEVDELGLSGHFSFLPFSADPSTAYRAVDIVAFPNQGVGLGRPVLEAAAYGKPVIASGSRRGAGILLPEQTGILLGDPTPEAIANAILLLVRDDTLRARLGQAAGEHARIAFDPSLNARLVERVYDELLGTEPGNRQ